MSASEAHRRETRQITDAQTMRALAHPTRLALLDLMRREGDITATAAAEALGDSPGNMSWHLQTLGKYGFVEETGAGKGRSRPWRIVPESSRFTASADDPGTSAAGAALVVQVLDRAIAQQREWLAVRPSYPPEWQDAAFLNHSVAYLTPDELKALCSELAEVFMRWDDRADDRRERPEGARAVNLIACGHPLPPTESGN